MTRAAAEAVIEAEIKALMALRGSLGTRFVAATTAIKRAKGKLVVTGMGKAGLIGQKISATLRSTGQPSVFLDPAQALHGCMGMIAHGDALLALSNSGKTDEVLAVCRYARDNDVRIISITSDQPNPLAEIAEYALFYPVMPEGCPIRRAPMSSAMQMLALGDALAASLMADRHFTEADFLSLHHGGYLGRTLAEELK